MKNKYRNIYFQQEELDEETKRKISSSEIVEYCIISKHKRRGEEYYKGYIKLKGKNQYRTNKILKELGEIKIVDIDTKEKKKFDKLLKERKIIEFGESKRGKIEKVKVPKLTQENFNIHIQLSLIYGIEKGKVEGTNVWCPCQTCYIASIPEESRSIYTYKSYEEYWKSVCEIIFKENKRVHEIMREDKEFRMDMLEVLQSPPTKEEEEKNEKIMKELVEYKR